MNEKGKKAYEGGSENENIYKKNFGFRYFFFTRVRGREIIKKVEDERVRKRLGFFKYIFVTSDKNNIKKIFFVWLNEIKSQDRVKQTTGEKKNEKFRTPKKFFYCQKFLMNVLIKIIIKQLCDEEMFHWVNSKPSGKQFF